MRFVQQYTLLAISIRKNVDHCYFCIINQSMQSEKAVLCKEKHPKAALNQHYCCKVMTGRPIFC